MKIFNLPEQHNNLSENEPGKFWVSFSSFNLNAQELKNQDRDIFLTKTDFENCNVICPNTATEKYEKRERMV